MISFPQHSSTSQTLVIFANKGQINNLTFRTKIFTMLGGLLSVAKAWLAKHDLSAKLNPNANLTIDSLTLSRPMTGKLDKWTKEMAPAELGQRLADTLIKLGWDITSSKESKAMLTSTLDMTLKKNGVTLSELKSLATLYQPLPVGLNAFTLTPNDDGTYRVEMRIQYLGEVS
ncbi:hypothetical protein [Vibrio parahaemolyticus]|uniref:hypothetical protein n=1 Tax=Vibrio parahaemolyticus TaxID=670 RepID=UPI00298FA98C|nr:hypothetical protein [Vibrio parahaemolyticus]MDW9225301.1 hypothetical protein [Vibrio parahaemolyticus]